MVIKVSALSLRTYLNRALIFISKAKLGVQPLFGCVHLKADKLYVYNGETGAAISMPFSVEKDILFYPFELAKVVDSLPDDEEVELKIDVEALDMKVKTSTIKIKIRLVDPANFPKLEVPELETFEVLGIYRAVKNASFCTSDDASLPLLQSIQISNTAVCATDQRGVWQEKFESPHTFLVPLLLREHMNKLGTEPARIGLTDSQIFFFYADMIMYGVRMSEEVKFPGVVKVLQQILTQEVASTVKFDREAFQKRFAILRQLPGKEEAIRLKCINGELTAENVISDNNSTQGTITLGVDSTADFDGVVVNGGLFENALDRFNNFKIMSDNKRIIFSNDTQTYGLTRKAL